MKEVLVPKWSKSNSWLLENDDVKLAVEKATGLIRSIVFKRNGKDLFGIRRQNQDAHAGYVQVFDERDDLSYTPLTARFKLASAVKKGNTLTLVRKYVGAPFVLTETLRLDAAGLGWDVRAEKVNKKVRDRSMRVGFNLPLHAGWDVWAPCRDGQFTFDGLDEFNFNYLQITGVSPREIILPAVSHYSKDADCGYTLLDPISARVPAARFRYDNARKLFNWGYNLKPTRKLPTLECLNYYIGLVKDRPMTTRAEVVFHEGDWRPGVGKIYAKYREFFDPDSPVIYDYEGVFNCGGIDTGENPAWWLEYGLKTLEVHGHFSYYSDYFQEGQDRWPTINTLESLRRKWMNEGREPPAQEVWDWMNGHTPHEIAVELFGADYQAQGIDPEKRLFHTRARIHDMLTKIRAAGICPFWYFNYTDGFRPKAEERWPDGICRDQDGEPMPSGWHMSHNMNADPSTSWGQFCDRSIRRILEEYPQLVGFFLDCFRHYEIDYAHDDGVTVVDHRPAYSVNLSYDWITSRIKHHMRELGCDGALFANKPQTVRCMRHVDGVLLEGDGDIREEKFFWACIAKPNFFMWTSNTAGLDENLRRAVLQGCFPRVDKPGKMSHEEASALYQKHLPLYEPFRRRVLCFEPDPLRVPRGARGKLYTVHDGYVAGLVTTDIDSATEIRHGRTPYALFRVQRGWDVGKVGVMYPGDKDFRTVEFKFNGTMIAAPLAEYKNCAVVKLFVTGQSGKAIGPERFTGPIDFCGDPENSFQDITKR